MRPARLFHQLSALFLSAALLAACAPPKPAFKGTDIGGVEWGGDFTLTAHTGKPIRVSDYQGKVVVLFFGYTHCPDICAPTLTRLSTMLRQLGPEAERVQVLFVTVDPKHDTVAQLASFVPKFHPTILGLTGSEQEIGKVAQDYKVAFQHNPGTTVIDHFGGILMKDPKGRLRLLFKNDATAEDMTHDVRLLLKEKG